MPEHILSLSYGKDSMACFGACELLGWPIDRVVTADVWATDTIPADLPPMVEFKSKADKIIKERWGIEVEHVRAKRCYQDVFYMTCESDGGTGRENLWLALSERPMVQLAIKTTRTGADSERCNPVCRYRRRRAEQVPQPVR